MDEKGYYAQVAGIFGYYGVNTGNTGIKSVSLGLGVQASVGIAGTANYGALISVDDSLSNSDLNPFSPTFDFPFIDVVLGGDLAIGAGTPTGTPMIAVDIYNSPKTGLITTTLGPALAADLLEAGVYITRPGGWKYDRKLGEWYDPNDPTDPRNIPEDADPNGLSDNWDNSDPTSESGPEPDADDSEAPSGGLTKPVIIDLSAGAAADQSSDGLDFYGLYNSPVFFNSDADAFRERTAWVGPNEGIVTHVSTAKDGATLFEIALTNAVKSQYGIEASTDMEALYLGFDKGVDANKDGTITLAEGKGDGKITAAEAESLGLKIWRDADMDGVVDAGEMVSFAEVKALYHTATNASRIQQ